MLLLCPEWPVRRGLERHQDFHSGLWWGSAGGPQAASGQRTTKVRVAPFPIPELSQSVLSFPDLPRHRLSSKLFRWNLHY